MTKFFEQKDKASVLSIAREQLSSLQGEISKLLERNREVEAKLAGEREIENDLRPEERFNVRIRHIPESTSRERTLDLRVVLRGDIIRVDDLMIRLLEFLKQINNVSLVSIEARTLARAEGDTSIVLVISLRLKIEVKYHLDYINLVSVKETYYLTFICDLLIRKSWHIQYVMI